MPRNSTTTSSKRKYLGLLKMLIAAVIFGVVFFYIVRYYHDRISTGYASADDFLDIGNLALTIFAFVNVFAVFLLLVGSVFRPKNDTGPLSKK